MIKKIKYFFQAIIIYLCFIIGWLLGLKLSRKLFSYLFLKIGPFVKSKNTVNNNLDKFSKKLSTQEKSLIIKEMWKNYGKTFIEYTFLNYFRKNKSHISIKGKEILLEIKDNKQPVIFVSGHFANFELMSMEITRQNILLATIYRPLNNIFLNPFMEYLRKKHICKNQIKKGIKGVKEAINYIKSGHSIALMIDQRVSEGRKINFFGYPALTTTLPAQLSNKFDLDIVPVLIKRNKNNSFEIHFLKKIKSKTFENKEKLTQELNKVLENMIIQNPNQWIWTHNRWK
mgnify:CR=1 FL=1|tara:strand:- start:6261 stop:7118 length:858 start_codon:yes stop_codon:yes gene_type:complete